MDSNKITTASGTASIVFGILSLLFFWVPLYNLFFIILAMVLGSSAKRKGDDRGWHGLIMGSLSILFAVVIYAAYFMGMAGKEQRLKDAYNQYVNSK